LSPPSTLFFLDGRIAEALKAELEKMINKQVNLNIVEVSNIDLDAKLVAENIAMLYLYIYEFCNLLLNNPQSF